jgi:predicted DsbA family dithiol-disulfide isomerase
MSHGAFQLDENLPSEGVDKYELLSQLIPPSALDPMIDILCTQFRELGMEMNPRGMIGNSAPAHRLQIWAEENCTPEQALMLKDQLFKIHCCQGISMSDSDAIVQAAAKAGLTDESKIRSIIKDSKYTTKLKRQIKHAKKDLDIQSVPCLMVIKPDGRQRKLEKATSIETIQGFVKLIAKYSSKRSESISTSKRSESFSTRDMSISQSLRDEGK